MTANKKTIEQEAAKPAPAKAVKVKKEPAAAKTAPVEAAAVPELASEQDSAKKVAKKDRKDKKKGKKKAKKNKEAVIIRFDDAQLPLIDSEAEALGLSRAAWVRMVVAKALANTNGQNL